MNKSYNKTKWVDGKTPINAQNLNKLEEAVKYLFETAIDSNFIKEGEGINISPEGKISVDSSVMTSGSVRGIEVISDPDTEMRRGILYFVLDELTLQLKEIILNKVVIFKRGCKERE